MLPSVPEVMGNQFRTAISGKDAFPVAVCAHTALQGGIIGEVPCLFPDKKVSSVEGLAVHFIKCYLKFFTPHFRRTVMEPGESIGAVFGHHHGFSDLFPEIQFQIPGVGSSFQVTGQIVPSVISVQADHIHGPGHDVLLVIILTADKGDGTVLRIQTVPFVSLKNATFMKNEMAGIDVTDEVLARYRADMTREEGEQAGVQLAKEVIVMTEDFADGYYFSFPFNRVTMLEKILN